MGSLFVRFVFGITCIFIKSGDVVARLLKVTYPLIYKNSVRLELCLKVSSTREVALRNSVFSVLCDKPSSLRSRDRWRFESASPLIDYVWWKEVIYCGLILRSNIGWHIFPSMKMLKPFLTRHKISLVLQQLNITS